MATQRLRDECRTQSWAPRKTYRGLSSRDLPPDMSGDEFRHPIQLDLTLRLATLYGFPHHGRIHEGGTPGSDFHDRPAGYETARAGLAVEDTLPRAPRRLDGHGTQGSSRQKSA